MEQQKKKSNRRRNIFIVVGILFLLAIIGHFSSGDKDTKATASNSSAAGKEAAPADNTKKIGDQVTVGDFSYVVNSAQFAKTIGNDFTKATADGVFLIVDVTFRNNDNEEHTLDNSFFKLTDDNGTEFSSSSDGESALEMSGHETLFLKQCNPHITKRGLLVFEVPEKKIYDLHLSGGFWDGNTAIVQLAYK